MKKSKVGILGKPPVKTYSIKLKPTAAHIAYFEHNLYLCRELYNCVVRYFDTIYNLSLQYNNYPEFYGYIHPDDKEWNDKKTNFKIKVDSLHKYPAFDISQKNARTKNVRRFTFYTDKQGRDIITLDEYLLHSMITELRAEREEYNNLSVNVLRDVVNRICLAFKKFYDNLSKGMPIKKAGHPKLYIKERLDKYKSFEYADDCKIISQERGGIQRLHLKIPKQPPIFFVQKCPIPDKPIKVCTIERKADGWYAHLVADCEPMPLPKTGAKVGIDVGIRNLLTDSDGGVVKSPKYYRQNEERLARLQREKDHKVECLKKENAKRQKAAKAAGEEYKPIRKTGHILKLEKRIAKLHLKVARQRKGTMHNISTEYIRKYDHICVEDLRITNMVKNRKLSKSIMDSGWGMFVAMLQEKAKPHGKTIEKVTAAYTSKTCSVCGDVNKKLKRQTFWNCPNCNTQHDRDINAAIVIRDSAHYKELKKKQKELTKN